MADEANAAAGLITGEQLEYVFSTLYENDGGLSVDILVKLAGYYKWNTENLLEAVCFYINCRQTVIPGEDLKAVWDARHEAAALKNRLRMVSDAFPLRRGLGGLAQSRPAQSILAGTDVKVPKDNN